ncbi:MAG: AAA family ATPase [Bacteroidales bacterium]|nr:AAA family ATPase [Bacteroidales bacterium]
MEQLLLRYHHALESTPTQFVRYLDSQIDWESRLIGILGARGVGKTTLMRQRIKMHEDISTTLYVDAGDIYFATHRLYDLAENFYKNGGKKLFIDEIHRYDNWSTEIKMIYDFLEDFKVVYSGSSILDLEKGGADLSRRKSQHYLYGLSFREFLKWKHGVEVPVMTLDDILKNKESILPSTLRPVALFKEYLKTGYYPFSDVPDFWDKLTATVSTSLERDIPQYAKLTMGSIKKIKKLFFFLAQHVPFKPNASKIGATLGIDRNDIPDLLEYLNRAQLISMVSMAGNGMASIREAEKLFLDNTSLSYALSDQTPDIGTLRETAFCQMTRVTEKVLASPSTDFFIGGKSFEVGGPNKGTQQIAGTTNSYVVRDDTEYRSFNFIPLWHFGFLY